MSERNYQRLRKKGVTGPHTSTCFIAAFDRITPPAQVDPLTYLLYNGYAEVHDRVPKKLRNDFFVQIMDKLAPDLGLDTHKDFDYENVKTARQLGHLVKACFKREIRMVFDIHIPNPGMDVTEDDTHGVGLIPVSLEPARFILRSTYVPRGFGGVIAPTELFDLLAHQDPKTDPYMKKYPFNDANVTTFPIYRPPEAS